MTFAACQYLMKKVLSKYSDAGLITSLLDSFNPVIWEHNAV